MIEFNFQLKTLMIRENLQLDLLISKHVLIILAIYYLPMEIIHKVIGNFFWIIFIGAIVTWATGPWDRLFFAPPRNIYNKIILLNKIFMSAPKWVGLILARNGALDNFKTTLTQQLFLYITRWIAGLWPASLLGLRLPDTYLFT